MTKRKLTMVSYSVTPICRKIERSVTISQKQRAILEGLLKIKESMIPVSAQTSHRMRKSTRITTRARRTIRRWRRRRERNSSCPCEILFIVIQLLPYFIKISLKFRCVPPVQRGIFLQGESDRDNAHDRCRPFGQDDDPV